jgi:hypothetical protein
MIAYSLWVLCQLLHVCCCKELVKHSSMHSQPYDANSPRMQVLHCQPTQQAEKLEL